MNKSFLLSLPLLSCSPDMVGLTPLPPVDTGVDSEVIIVDSEEVDTSDDTDVVIGPIEPTGLVGGVAQVSYLWVPCDQCFFGQVGNELAHSSAMFHTPTPDSWLDWLPDSGCITEDLYPAPPVTGYNLGYSIGVHSDGLSNFSMDRVVEDGQYKYRRDNLSSTLLYEQIYFDLTISQNNVWPAAEFDNAIYTPTLFTQFQPMSLFNSSLFDAYEAPIYRNSTNYFSWQPAGGDIFIILVEVYSWDGLNYLGGVLCSEPDDGAIQIPSGYFSQYPYGSLAAVYAYKMYRTETIIPFNGSTLEGVGQYGALGTATLY